MNFAVSRKKFKSFMKGILGLAVLGTAGLVSSFTANAEIQYDYNVTDPEFGANGADSAIDNEGLQGALNKAKGAEKMVTIYVPAGTYYVEKPLGIYSNTHLILDDKAVIARKGAGLNNNLMHNCDQDGKMDQIGGYNMSHDIILEGGTFDGGELKSITSSSDVVRFDHAENITIKNCVLKNAYDCHILEFIGVKNGLVSGCTFEGFRYRKGKEKNYEYAREAFQIEAAWTDNENDLSNTSGRWAQGSVVDGTACDGVTVTDNTFINMPCGVGQHHYSKSGKARCKNIVISNNTLTCASSMKYCKTAISCTGIDNLQVTGNTITGPYRFAVHEIQSTEVSIDNNTITNTGITPVMIESGKVVSISGNTLKNAGKHAIAVGGGTIGKIDNNVITSPKRNGINVTAGTVTSISGNEVKNVGANGISAAKVSGSKGGTIKLISNNKITKPKGTGITVDLGKVTNIKGNTIKNTGRHGICVLGGTVGTGSKKTAGILNNTITTCKQNGITVSTKAKISAIGSNKITGAKNNGISLTPKCKVKWVVKNTVKKCKNHDIWIGVSGVKVSGNKAKVDKG